MKLKDKTVLVTGGTGGLGKALVRQFLQSGAAVHFTYFQAEPEARGLEDSGARGHKLDLSDMRAVETFAGAFMRETEGLHVLIHNAAATRDRLLRDMTEDDWDYVLKVDLKAPYYLTQQLLPAIRRTAAAKIFMLTSRAAFTGSAGLTNYAAAKAGIIGLVKSLAQELGESGILVNAVNPGFMKSRMTEGLSEEIVERNLSSSPLRAFSDPEEVAGFIVYLASGAMTQVTGQVFSFESRGIAW